MIVAPFVTRDFCSGSLRSAGTHRCIRISIKGVRIMGQGFGDIFRLAVFSKLWRSRRAVQSTYWSIVVATQLYKYSFGDCVDLAQIGLAKWLG